jgi:hypothetical protein
MRLSWLGWWWGGVKLTVRCQKSMKQRSLPKAVSSCNILYLSTPVFVCTDMNLKLYSYYTREKNMHGE